jgi:hypothetical protein
MTKIEGYKQIGDAVYQLDKSNNTYRLIGRNKTQIPLQQYVNQLTNNWKNFITQTKEKLK